MSRQLFSETEQKRLLEFARSVISAQLTGAASPETPDIPGLENEGSCFVTLHLKGELRGCIGNIEAFEALGENIRHNALNAAFKDPRFPAVSAEEFKETDLEISILTPAEAISSPEEFCPGEHGIILSLFGRRSVFLPQVAAEQGWDRETTLDFLARKAGFPGNAWKSKDARFFIFRSEIYR